jgi:hypothetical protein
LLTGSAISAKMKKEIAKIRQAVELTLQNRFERAGREDALTSKTSPSDFAWFYAVVLQGLGPQARKFE